MSTGSLITYTMNVEQDSFIMLSLPIVNMPSISIDVNFINPKSILKHKQTLLARHIEIDGSSPTVKSRGVKPLSFLFSSPRGVALRCAKINLHFYLRRKCDGIWVVTTHLWFKIKAALKYQIKDGSVKWLHSAERALHTYHGWLFVSIHESRFQFNCRRIIHQESRLGRVGCSPVTNCLRR